uniref:Uncharacterized protein n=1 Tax=Zea mays TaxID=4577 RepID=B7ZZF5_MAIZE|nr:unknown [Zea mays]
MPSPPISALRSLRLCSNSSILAPISSIFEMMFSDIAWNLVCICIRRFCTKAVISAVLCAEPSESCSALIGMPDLELAIAAGDQGGCRSARRRWFLGSSFLSYFR